ncbi:MAG: hypothetical protein R2788_04505 [Saprospiraceae bacterium]
MINGTVDFVVSVSNVNGAGADDDTLMMLEEHFSVTVLLHTLIVAW